MSLECLDPRDCVYSILGLCSTDHSIVPDYRPTKSVLDVYREAAMTCAPHERSTDFLVDLLEVKSGQGSAWPSWVPDYSQPAGRTSLLIQLSSERGHHCTQNRQPNVEFLGPVSESVPSIMRARSLTFCTPLTAEGLGVPATDSLKTRELFQVWLGMAFVQTRTHQGSANLVAEEFVESVKQVTRFGEAMTHGFVFNKNRVSDDKSTRYANYLTTLRSDALYGGQWRLFCLMNGVMGMTVSETRPGGKISFILGCRIPIVLRPRSEGNGYTVVGGAYVHGYKDGLAIECRKLRWEDIY
jgi:hypothetical protein